MPHSPEAVVTATTTPSPTDASSLGASSSSADAPPPLEQASLAYLSEHFLDSLEGRPLRILAEYAEPMARFREQRIEDTVVFFGSARFSSMATAQAALARLEAQAPVQPANRSPNESPDQSPDQSPDHAAALHAAHAAVDMARFYEDARTLAHQHAAWARSLPGPRHRFVVTSGGGPGIMEAANRGAWEAGARTIGLNITLPFEQLPNRWITPELNFNFHYFFMRKFWFASLAKALVIFPGGFGTLDEAFELLTLAQTGKLQKKLCVVLYGRDYWQSILNLEAMAERGAISPRDLNLFQYADTPAEAFELLQTGLRPALNLPVEPADPSPPVYPAPSPQQILGPDIARSS